MEEKKENPYFVGRKIHRQEMRKAKKNNPSDNNDIVTNASKFSCYNEWLWENIHQDEMDACHETLDKLHKRNEIKK